jgi:hypothetical protein
MSAPTVRLRNLTHPDLAPDFEVGDTFQITVTGAPNQLVSVTQTPGGTTQMGRSLIRLLSKHQISAATRKCGR